MTESRIQSEIRLAIGQRDDVMLFRINVGKFRPLHGPSDRVIQSAPNGTPDLLGVIAPGRALAIEVKSQKGALRAEQRAFRKAWEARGGLYIVARCVDDVLQRISSEKETQT
jgi:hypothetical protein